VIDIAGLLGQVVYLRSTSADGNAWPLVDQILLSLGGKRCDMKIINGTPAVSFTSAIGGIEFLHYSHSLTFDGSGGTWPAAVQVDFGANLLDCALSGGDDAGNPMASTVVLRQLAVGRDLNPAAGDENWSAPPALLTNYAGAISPQFDLAAVDGDPAAAWGEDGTSNKFRYLRTDSSPWGGWTPSTALTLMNITGSGRTVSVSNIQNLGPGGDRGAASMTTQTGALYICVQPVPSL
jgi:hypothetical protein